MPPLPPPTLGTKLTKAVRLIAAAVVGAGSGWLTAQPHLHAAEPIAPNQTHPVSRAVEQQLRDGRFRQACTTLTSALALDSTRCALWLRDRAAENLQPALSQTLGRSQGPSESELRSWRLFGETLRSAGASNNALAVFNAIQKQLAPNSHTDQYLQLSLARTYQDLGKRRKIYQEFNTARDHYQQAIAHFQAASRDRGGAIHRLALIGEWQATIELSDPDLAPLDRSTVEQRWLQLVEALTHSQADSQSSVSQYELMIARLNFLKSGLCAIKPVPRSAHSDQSTIQLAKRFKTPSERFCQQHSSIPWQSLKIAPHTIQTWIEEAIQFAEQAQNPQLQSEAIGLLGEFYERQGQLPTALRQTQRALSFAQSHQILDSAYRWQAQIGRLLLADKQPDAAEQAYSVAFESLQFLRRSALSLDAAIQLDFRDEVEPIYRDYLELLLADSDPRPEQLLRAVEVIEALQIAAVNDLFRDACLPERSESIDTLLANTATDRTAVVYWILLADRWVSIVRLPNQAKLEMRSTAVNTQQLNRIIDETINFLQTSADTYNAQVNSYHLYQQGIHPIKKILEEHQIDTLAFVSDGNFKNINLAALYDASQRKHLIEQYALSSVPALKFLDSKPTVNSFQRVLAATTNRFDPSPSGHVPLQLEKVDNELANINASRLPARVVRDQDFTLPQLQAAITEYEPSIVHIITHGEFSSDPDKTYLRMRDRPATASELGLLLRADRRRRYQSINLLLLTACNTAEGDQRATLGLAGLTIQAGASRTISSLWRTNGSVARLFTKTLYQGLRTDPHLSMAKRVQKAQITLRQQNSSFVDWAGFVLVGHWR